MSDDFGLLALLFSEPDKDYFEQKEEPSANIFAISLLISPSAFSLSLLSHSVCPNHVFPLSFPLSCCRHSSTLLVQTAFIFVLALKFLCSLHSFDRRHHALCLASHWPPSLFLSSSSLYFQCDSLFVYSPVHPLSVCTHIEQTIPSFITPFKLHGASSPWSPYLTNSVPRFNAVINKKSVWETFSYIIANKPTFWFADGLSKKLTNYQPPYSFCSKTNWNLTLSKCILAPQVASILVSTCCLTHVLVELESLPFHLPPGTYSWYEWSSVMRLKSGRELSWAARSLCMVDGTALEQSPSGGPYTVGREL